MSKPKTETRDNRRDIELPPNVNNEVPEEVEEQSGAEKLLMASQPYWSHIVLGLLICILAWVVVNYLMLSSRESAAEPSRQLADAMQQFNATGNVDSLKQMRIDYPNEKATNWAMMTAGDYELNRGLRQFPSSRDDATKLIKKAKESFQSVVDSPASARTTMQLRNSLYSLAYANESLGDFESAKTLYQRVIDEAPDSIFAQDAKSGLGRVSNPDFKRLYDDFVSYEPTEEEAPGAAVPNQPNIDFPKINLPKQEPEGPVGATETPDSSSEKAMVGEVAKPATDVTEGTEMPKTEAVETPAVEVKETTIVAPVEGTEVVPAAEPIETAPAIEPAPAIEVTEPVEGIKEVVEGVEAAGGIVTETVTEGAGVVVDAVKEAVEAAGATK